VNESSSECRLAAILAADMVGYSRLMEADEAGTLARLNAIRAAVLDPAIGRAHGRIVKTTGDGVLFEFRSIVDAVRTATEIQRGVDAAEAAIDPGPRIAFRIGINLGDVIVKGDDLFGDGVNIAARLQALAEPGGISVAAAVIDHVGHRVDVTFDDLGEQAVRNIARPIRAFRIAGFGAEPTRAAAVASDPKPNGPVDARPSAVVLPLLAMGGDADGDLFADGMTEDLITEISRFRDLLVISCNTSFAFKGRATKVKDVARELGVQYVVKGSVRRAGNRVRVTVQLIDAEADRHVWAERYDRDLEDLFAIQDDVTRSIVGVLPGRVQAAHRERATKKPTTNMTAYELVLACKTLHHRSNESDNAEALRLLERAIALNPNFAHAHAWKACVLGRAWSNGFTPDPGTAWNELVAELEIALRIDDNDSDVHRILAAVSTVRDDLEKAAYHQERALALNPNDDLIVVQQGELLTRQGRAEEGITWVRQAMRPNPFHAERYWSHLGRACFVARRYGEAVQAYRRIRAPDPAVRATLAGALAMAGEAAAAREEAAEVLRRAPDFTIAGFMPKTHYGRAEDADHHRAALRAAGLPEG